MPQDLGAAYIAAHYRVFADPPFVLRAGEPNDALDSLLVSHAVTTWAFITACNPGSVQLTVDVNAGRMNRLCEVLSRFVTYSGEGGDPTGEWPSEASVLAVGISRGEALEVAKAFGQNAILAGQHGGPAELVWVTSP